MNKFRETMIANDRISFEGDFLSTGNLELPLIEFQKQEDKGGLYKKGGNQKNQFFFE